MTKTRLDRASLRVFALAGRKLIAGLLLTPDDCLLEINHRKRWRRADKTPNPGRYDFLRPLQVGQEDHFLRVDGFLDQMIAGQRALQSLGHDLVLDLQEFDCPVLEDFHRQGAVAIAGRLNQDVAQPGAGANQRIHRDANLLRDLIGGLKSNALNVCGQPVRVATDFLDGVLAVSFVNAHGPAGADAIGVQENHNVTDDLLLIPRPLDSFPALRANAVHIFQPGRRFFDNVKYPFAKFVHKLLGAYRADALDHTAAKVFLDAFLGRWWCAGEHLGSELLPVFPVLNPTALGREPFPGADGRKGANYSHQVPVPFGFDFEHAESHVLVEKRDALNQPRKTFRHYCGYVLHSVFIL